jgi:hypothetical protein
VTLPELEVKKPENKDEKRGMSRKDSDANAQAKPKPTVKKFEEWEKDCNS